MNVELSEWATNHFAEMVASGRFSCEREAIDYAIASFEANERPGDCMLDSWPEDSIAELEQSLRRAMADLDAGKGVPVTRELIDEIKRSGHEELAVSTQSR